MMSKTYKDRPDRLKDTPPPQDKRCQHEFVDDTFICVKCGWCATPKYGFGV